MDRKIAVFSAAEMLAWKENGIPEKWHPYNNLISLTTGGGNDGGGSPIRSPFVVPECAVLEIMPRGYLQYTYISTLALKLFRREPAISQFVWNFSAIHKSSKHFSTCPGSGLQCVLPHLHPAHG